MTTAIYAGSFDPFTTGHLNVLKEAANIFDKVIVVIAVNSDKKRRIDSELMLKGIQNTIDELIGNDKAKVVKFEGLIADLAREEETDILIRGIRNGSDYEYEENIAKVNESFGLKTMYIRAGRYSYVSSSMVMELYKYGKDISAYVPSEILPIIEEEINKWDLKL